MKLTVYVWAMAALMSWIAYLTQPSEWIGLVAAIMFTLAWALHAFRNAGRRVDAMIKSALARSKDKE